MGIREKESSLLRIAIPGFFGVAGFLLSLEAMRHGFYDRVFEVTDIQKTYVIALGIQALSFVIPSYLASYLTNRTLPNNPAART